MAPASSDSGASLDGSGSLNGKRAIAPSDVQLIGQLADLRDRGALTDEEFAEEKRRILGLESGFAAVRSLKPEQTRPARAPYPFAIVLCSKCGGAVEEGAHFCPACGQDLSVAPLHAAGARKRVTVVFSDITGSTSLGERLGPRNGPECPGSIMQTRCAAHSRAHGGSVEKFIGDAVMAVFGVPIVHEDDALRASSSRGRHEPSSLDRAERRARTQMGE